jgi:hypothetical protein
LDHSLASECGITMDLDGYNTVSVDFSSTKEMLLSASSSTDHRVDGLEMRRVSEDSDFNCLLRFTVSASEGCSQMIFNITSTREARLTFLVGASTLEFSHDLFHGLSHDVSEHV